MNQKRSKKNSDDDLSVTHCFNDPINHLDTSGHLFFRVSHNETMQVFFSIFCVLIRLPFTLFHTSFAANANFSTTLPFHLLETVATRANQEAKEIDFWKLFDWNVNFFCWSLRTFLLVIFNGRAEVWVSLKSTVDKPNTLFFQFLAVSNFTCVGSPAMCVVCGRR